jgi:AraC-like DNA-binding protein
MLKCCEYLKTTHMKLKDIATHVGFNSNIAFSNAFKNTFNMTPGLYRKTHGK